MALQLENIIPFGRSQAEYELMFGLSATDLQKSIIGVGDGTTSFNAEMFDRGNSVISIDPLYQSSATEIVQQFDRTVDGIFQQIDRTPDDWIWNYHPSPSHLRAARNKTVQIFASDYSIGKSQGRYICGELPHLPFPDRSFDLALSSYLLFVYSKQLDLEFHCAAIREMCRVATEVRIFPLVTAENHHRSPYVDAVRSALSFDDINSEIFDSAYELQKGGNQGIAFAKMT
jgi:SAM-dependent methyltransferase